MSTIAPRPSLLLIGKSRANDVWHRIREDIISGVLVPDTRLRFEQLRSVYGVSFATLREALSRLATENLVVADAQRGFRVTRVSTDNLLDLTRVRVMVESEALRLSIANANETWRDSVLRAFHQMDQTGMKDKPVSPRWADLHRTFHTSLVSACNSPLLIDLCARLFDSASRYRNISMRRRVYTRDKSHDHREIMEAALGGDADAAVDLISAHIWETTNNVVALIRDPEVTNNRNDTVAASENQTPNSSTARATPRASSRSRTG